MCYKGVENRWYINNIENNTKNYHYGQYLEDEEFCNNRSIFLVDGIYTSSVAFGRISGFNKTVSPLLTCPQQADVYTTKIGDNKKGNTLLDYPIALLTADEVSLAGAVQGSPYEDSKLYLDTSLDFWLMFPYDLNANGAINFYMKSNGTIYYDYVNQSYGVRPSLS